VVQIVIGTLAGRNLIHDYADTYGTPAPEVIQWRLTGPGEAVLQLFREAGEAAAGAPTPDHEDRPPRDEGDDD
jgi:hypothetical protein